MLPSWRVYFSQFLALLEDQASVDHNPLSAVTLHFLYAQRLPFLLPKHLRPLWHDDLRWSYGRCLVCERAILNKAVGQTGEDR